MTKTTMDVDKPHIVAEVRAAFDAYEKALAGSDGRRVDDFYFDAPSTVRYGAAEMLYGYSAIVDANSKAPAEAPGMARELDGTVITTYGDDMAVASTLVRRARMPGKIGRQMQTWLRTPAGWKVVAAHVSVIDDPTIVPATGAGAERRVAQRYKTLKSIRIILPGGMSTIDCVVRNRSETGLLLRLNGPVVLPPEFEVLLDASRRPVRVVWKKGLELGVAYTG